MEIKTLSYLNSKAWYRFLKVVFILGLLVALGILNFIIFSEGIKTINEAGTIVHCNIDGEKTFTAASKGLSLDSSNFVNGQFDYKNYFEGYNDIDGMTILKGCVADTNTTLSSDMYDEQKIGEIINKYGLIGVMNKTPAQVSAINTDFTAYQQETKDLFGSAKAQYLDFSFHLFDITPAYTYTPFLERFLVGNFLILIAFEIIRRVFYYIVLGTLRPKKHNPV